MPELPASPSSVSNCTATAGGAVSPCEISSVVVEFRPPEPHTDYYGEFGFDWLRVKEAPTTEPSYINGSDATIGTILGGYKTATSDYTNTEAQDKWKGATSSNGEYEKFTITRAATTFRHLTYYVPYLNLYPNKGVTATPISYTDTSVSPAVNKVAPKPPHTAKLRMIIDVKGSQAPERVEIEYSSTNFELKVDGAKVASPYIIPNNNYTITPDTIRTSKEVIKAGGGQLLLEITCLKELTTDQRIEVYAYHKKAGSTATPPELEKKLAGKLIVCKNDKAASRKTFKIVFVKVKTDFNNSGSFNIGSFANEVGNNKEIDNLYNTLYQALIYSIITTQAINPKTGVMGDIELDLTKDPKFLTTTTTIGTGASAVVGTGEYLNSAGTKLNEDAADFFEYLRDEFFRQYPSFNTGYFVVFTFDEPTYDNTMGQVGFWSNDFQKVLVLFKDRDGNTLNHETLHGLKLMHTHRDLTPLQFENIKYIFIEGDSSNIPEATTNVMGYNSDAYTTWYWQWLIMRNNV